MRRGSTKPELARRLEELHSKGVIVEQMVYRQPSFDRKIQVGGVDLRFQVRLGKTIDTTVMITERYDDTGNYIDEHFQDCPIHLRLENAVQIPQREKAT